MIDQSRPSLLEWRCGVCTRSNEGCALNCLVCGTPRARDDGDNNSPWYVDLNDLDIVVKPIGKGCFGVVHVAFSRTTSSVFAIKMSDGFERECEMLRSLKHPRIVKCFDYGPGYCVMEYVGGGELYSRILRRTYTQAEAKLTAFQILDAVAYLHEKCIVHRDLKPENILLKKNDVKLCDFGSARYIHEMKRDDGFVTPEYAAPEVLRGEKGGYGVDCWSVGIVVYVMLNGVLPSTKLSPFSCCSLLPCLLDENLSTRFSARAAQQHDWFPPPLRLRAWLAERDLADINLSSWAHTIDDLYEFDDSLCEEYVKEQNLTEDAAHKFKAALATLHSSINDSPRDVSRTQ